MKIVLTETELQEALTNGAPVPPSYSIVAVDFQKYSNDFCTLTLARTAILNAIMAPAPEPTIVELPLSEPEAA